MDIELGVFRVEELMLHPLLPKQVGFKAEDNAFFHLIETESIHRDFFLLNEASLEKKEAFEEKLLRCETQWKKTSFSGILLRVVKGDEPSKEIPHDEKVYEQEKAEIKRSWVPLLWDRTCLDEMVFNLDLSFWDGPWQRQDLQRLISEIVKGAQILKGDGKIGIRLHIREEGFSSIDVRLIMDENESIHIEFVVDDPETQALLKAGFPILRSRLEEAGVKVSWIDVRMRGEEVFGVEGWRVRSMDIDLLVSKINYVA